MSFQTQDFCLSSEQIKICLWNMRAFWPSIDSKDPNTIKAQKCSKGIVKIIPVTSVIQVISLRSFENTFCATRENKNNDFIQQIVSSASPYSAILESITYVNNICNACTRIRCLRSDQSVNSVSTYGAADAEQHTLFTYVILFKITL